MSMAKRRRGTKPLELSDDLIADIIRRVPDECFARFACVSKSCRSLTNPDSYLSRLRSFLLINKSTLSVSRDRYYHYSYLVRLDSIEDGDSNPNPNPNPREIDTPFDLYVHYHDRPNRDAYVIASCNGLLVFELDHPSDLKMAVLNPTTKKQHMVPPNPADDGDTNVAFCGFGYDHVHDSYKLVTKIQYTWSNEPLKLMVYDVSNGTWRKLQFDDLHGIALDDLGHAFGYYGHLDYFRVKCAAGAVYWCIDWKVEREMEKMICFVLADEKFHNVETPDFGEVKYYPDMTVFEGRLCLVMCERSKNFGRVEFWTVDMEYEESLYSWRWTKFLAITNPNSMLPPPYNLRRAYLLFPICFSARENKILFLVNQSRMYWYDLRKEEFLELNVPVNSLDYNGRVYDVQTCVRSLVGIGRF